MHIVLIKTSSLGDIVQTFPVVAYLREQLPQLELTWVVEARCAELVAAHPQVDRLLVVDTRCWRRHPFQWSSYTALWKEARALRQCKADLVIDLQGNSKSACLSRLLCASRRVGFGRHYVAEWPNLLAMGERYEPPAGGNVRDDYLWLAARAIDGPLVESHELPSRIDFQISYDERRQIEQLLSWATKEPRVPALLLAGSLWPNKQLSVETLIRFLDQLQKDEQFFWLLAWGDAAEQQMAQAIASHLPSEASCVLPQRLPLVALQQLMDRVPLVLAMDSLPLHLAATTSAATFGFFGPSLAQKYGPVGPHHGSVQGSCPYGIDFDKRCPKLRSCPTGACLKQLASEELLARFCHWWQRARAEREG